MEPPALIPAAGRGTRLRPVTRFVPKPLLPVGEHPVLEYVVREALQAGCRPVVVIVPADGTSLERFLEDRFGSEPVRSVEQPAPRGLADALVCGYESLTSSPDRVAMLLPDNLTLGGSGTAPLLDQSTSDERLVFGVIEVDRAEAQFFGNSGGFDGEKTPEGTFRITGLQSKGEGTFRRSGSRWPRPRTVGRVLLPARFFEHARRRSPDPETGEIDDVPVYREMLQSQFALGVQLEADLYDMGEPERYLRLCARVHEIRSGTDDSVAPDERRAGDPHDFPGG